MFFQPLFLLWENVLDAVSLFMLVHFNGEAPAGMGFLCEVQQRANSEDIFLCGVQLLRLFDKMTSVMVYTKRREI